MWFTSCPDLFYWMHTPKSARSTACSDVTAAFVWAENVEKPSGCTGHSRHFTSNALTSESNGGFGCVGTVRMSAKFGTFSLAVLLWGKRSAAWSHKARRGTPPQTLLLNVRFVTLTFAFGQWRFERHCWRVVFFFFSIMCFPCKGASGNIPLFHEKTPQWPQHSNRFPTPSGKVDIISLVSWKCWGPGWGTPPPNGRVSLPPWGWILLLSHIGCFKHTHTHAWKKNK